MTDKSYISVYFDQGDGAKEYLRMIHHKTDNSVLWECPTQESINAAVHAIASHYDIGEGTDILHGESACGYPNQTFDGAWNERVEMMDTVYILTYHVGLGYVGLEREVSA